MLRSDTTALFERLREANILLQEVLSGAHENMSEIENTLVTRVSEFVAAMNDVAQKTGVSNTQVEQQIAGFQTTAGARPSPIWRSSASQFDSQGRSLAEAVALIDRSNRRTEGALTERRLELEALVTTLDSKGNDLEQRLTRFSACSTSHWRARRNARARFPAWWPRRRAAARVRSPRISKRSAKTPKRNASAPSESMRSIYEQATGESQTMLAHAAERFADVVEGLKRMTSDMQRELETTRQELRKGILELPEETAESAAQMRRVIVDQIEALAELNRIVARHGRGLDAVEPGTRRIEPVEAAAPRRVAAERADDGEWRAALRTSRGSGPTSPPE